MEIIPNGGCRGLAFASFPPHLARLEGLGAEFDHAEPYEQANVAGWFWTYGSLLSHWTNAMNQNALYAIIAVLIIVGGYMGYRLYAERQQTSGVEIQVDKNGLSIQKK